MSGKGSFADDRLGGYVEVKDRIRLFYEKYPDGRLVTADVRWPAPDDDMPRVAVKAYAYRDPADVHPSVGWSWMVLPGSSSFTKGSELENTETSAWGRAIGALGIGIDKSVATRDEIGAKHVEADVDRAADGGLIGVAQVGDKSTSDYLLRDTPDGPGLGFRLRGDKGGILVEAVGILADQLDKHRDKVIGSRVTVYGSVQERTFTPKGKPKVSYQALAADRVFVPILGLLPAEETAEPEPPAEAPSVPLFTDEEQAAIDADIDAVLA